MLRALGWTWVLLAATAANADDSQERIEAIALAVRAHTAEVIERLEKQLAEQEQEVSKVRRKRVGRSFSAADKGKAIRAALAEVDETQVKLAEYRAGKQLAWPRLEYPLKLGAVGRINFPVNVAQVLGPQEMLINIDFTVPSVRIVGGRVLNSTRSARVLVLLRGIDTTGAVDGGGFDIGEVLEASGTHRYATAAGGTNTVFVLEPVNQQAVLEAVRNLAE